MSSNKKIEEGLEHIKNAEKSLKTSLLKWRPDYDNAADEYNKAATCFRNAKSYEQCKDCLLKAVDCYKQNRSLFYAAKALDQCILICKELGDLQEISNLAQRAAHMFQTHGSAESAAASLDKAAKILESQYPDDALKLYKHAAEIVTIQDSTRQAAEYTSKVARLHVKLRQFDLAADAVRRELGLLLQNESYQAAGRLTVALVLIQLARQDLVAAEKAFKEFDIPPPSPHIELELPDPTRGAPFIEEEQDTASKDIPPPSPHIELELPDPTRGAPFIEEEQDTASKGSYCEAPEVQTIEEILQAYDEEDPDSAKKALNSPFIKHMDVEYAILAREIPLPQGMCTPNVSKKGKDNEEEPLNLESTSGGDTLSKETPQETAEDEEYEGGLC